MFKAYFVDVLKNHYADFSGKAGRPEFWFFNLFVFVICLVLKFVPIVGWLVSLALLVPSIAIDARRLHDIGRSAWWLLLYFVPVLGWLVLLVFFLLPSKK